jgi:hypothetical protein
VEPPEQLVGRRRGDDAPGRHLRGRRADEGPQVAPGGRVALRDRDELRRQGGGDGGVPLRVVAEGPVGDLLGEGRLGDLGLGGVGPADDALGLGDLLRQGERVPGRGRGAEGGEVDGLRRGGRRRGRRRDRLGRGRRGGLPPARRPPGGAAVRCGTAVAAGGAGREQDGEQGGGRATHGAGG